MSNTSDPLTEYRPYYINYVVHNQDAGTLNFKAKDNTHAKALASRIISFLKDTLNVDINLELTGLYYETKIHGCAPYIQAISLQADELARLAKRDIEHDLDYFNLKGNIQGNTYHE